MESVNIQSTYGGGDGYRPPARSVGVSVTSPAWIKIVSEESGELSPPVVSVTSPAASSSSSSFIHEQSMNAATDWSPPETASSPDEVEGSDGGGNAVKKAVWSKPSNDVVEAVSPVMDAVLWPALGESTKAALSDGSLIPAFQVTVNSSPSSHKSATVIVNPVLTPTHVTHSGQSSMRRGGAYVSSTGGVSQQSPASHQSKAESPDTTTVLEPQPNSGNVHHYQQNSYRRGNGGSHSRADGSYRRNYGGKLDHGHGYGQGRGRGYQEWNQHRNFNNNNRDSNMQPQRGGYRRGGYTRPPAHNSTPFIPPPMPPPIGPFGNNVLYPNVASGMIYYPGPPPPIFSGPFYFPVPDPLLDNIMKQIDFYFSNDNLVKDTYLRCYMDEQGWVSVNLIAGFNKVSCLTDNVQLILDVMQKSTVVEVQGDKMRRRNDWMRWLLPPAVQDSLGSQLQHIGLDERGPVT